MIPRDFYLHPDGRVIFDVKIKEIVEGMLAYDCLTDQTHVCTAVASTKQGSSHLYWFHTEDPEHLARIKTTLLLI